VVTVAVKTTRRSPKVERLAEREEKDWTYILAGFVTIGRSFEIRKMCRSRPIACGSS
jgi:hypothetical protein